MSIQSITSSGVLNPTHTTPTGPQASVRQANSEEVAKIANTTTSPQLESSSTTQSQVLLIGQRQELESAVEAVKDFIQPKASNLAFEIDDDSGRTVIRITEASSGELIRQIPSEELLDIAKALDRLQGLLVKQKA